MKINQYSLLRSFIEKKFELLGYILYQRACLVIIILLPVVVFFTTQLFSLTFESSLEHYLQDKDSTLVTYSKFRDQFGSDDRVFLGITGQNVFSPATFKRLGALQKDLESKVPHIAQVKSLTSALYIKSQDDELIFGSLNDLFPDGSEDFAGFKDFVTSSSLYKRQYYSPDEELAIISLSLSCPSVRADSLDVLTDIFQEKSTKSSSPEIHICALNNSENTEMLAAINELKREYQSEDFQLQLTGMPVLRQFMRTTMKEDTKKFLSLSFVVIIVLLFVLFGRVSGVVYPLLIVFATVTTTFGLMVLMKQSFQAPTRILPSFLIAVGVGGSVHILFIFYQFFARGFSKKDAIAKALGHSGLPVVLTSITTGIGLASFSTAQVAPIANLGLFATLGVFISLFYTIILLPALIAIFPLKRTSAPLFIRFSRPVQLIIGWIVNVSVTFSKSIVLFSIGLLIISLFGIAQLKLVHNPLLRLPEQSALRQDTEAIAQHFPGMATVEILVKTPHYNGLTDPQLALKFGELEQQLMQYSSEQISVFNVVSIFDVLKEVHKNLIDDSDRLTSLPADAKLIAQEFLLLESGAPNTIRQLTDTNFQLGRVTVQVPWIDAMAYDQFLDDIESMSKEIFQESAEITITGIVSLLTRTIHATIESMVKSYIIAFLVISIAMVVLVGHFRLGLISMFPNLLPIFLTLGCMGWTGVPLDMYTLLIGSIALGLVVDDTIHFMYNFRKNYQEMMNVRSAVTMTFQTSGLAMLVTTIVLSCGAFVFMVSAMKNLYYFGLLTGLTIITALLADLFLAPALMALYYKLKFPVNLYC